MAKLNVINLRPGKYFKRFALKLLPLKAQRRLIMGKLMKGEGAKSPIIKIAESEEEIIAALRLHQENYQNGGLCQESSSGIRLTKYQALLTSTILVAKSGDKVVGTISTIFRGDLGLPIEAGWDISWLTKKNRSIVEFSAFAIDQETDLPKGVILLSLMKYAWNYAVSMGATDLVAVVFKEFSVFYKTILLHDEIKTRKQSNYKLVNLNSRPAAFHLNLEEALDKVEKAYRGIKFSANFYDYIKRDDSEQHILPKRTFPKYNDFHLTPRILKMAFSNELDQECTTNEKMKVLSQLHSVRFNESFDQSIVAYKEMSGKYASRSEIRVPFRGDAMITNFCQNRIDRASLKNISYSGARLSIRDQENKVNYGDRVKVSFSAGQGKKVELSGEVVSVSHNSEIGISFVSCSCPVWQDLIDYQTKSILLPSLSGPSVVKLVV